MITKSAAIGLALLALATPGQVWAKGIVYDCDTAANHFSELSLPAPKAFTVTGRVQLVGMADSKQFAALGRLAISNASDQLGPSREGWAGFEFTNIPGPKGVQTGLLQSTLVTKAAKQEAALGIASARDVAFSLTYAGSSVTMVVDGHSATLPFVADRPIVRIACSTGEFLIHDLEITAAR